MSTARVIKFPAQQENKPTEARVADCDNGYLRIANELFDEILKADLTKHQLKVALAVIRKTYGFNKKSDRFTNVQIAEMTGIPETRVCTAKNALLDAKILTYFGREIGLNKNLNEWILNIPQNGEELPETGRESFPKTGNRPSPKQGNTKDTYTKDNKDKEILKDITPPAQKSVSKKQAPSSAKQTVTELDYSSWPNHPDEQVLADWLKVRAKKKSPLTQTAVNSLAKQFPIAAQHGFSVDDCLSECVVRGWIGFEADWLLKNNRSVKSANSTIPRQNGFAYNQNDDQPVSGRL